MSLTPEPSGVPATQNGRDSPDNDISASRTTRYLSAAAHLRRPMLPDQVTDPGSVTSRPPLPVGRAYALRVLFFPGGQVPMSAIDMRKVKRNCRISLLQTTIRDLAAVGALTAGLVIEPWGMIITLGIVVAAVVLTRRSRFFLALIILGVVCVALALVNGNRSERISLGIPLACLAACFLVYLSDVLLSMHYVRRIWRQSAGAGKPRSSGRELIFRTPAKSEYERWLYADSNGRGGNGKRHGAGNGKRHGAGNGFGRDGYSSYEVGLSPSDNGRAAPALGSPARVYYGKDGIVGAGTSLPSLPLTVPLDKPMDANREVETFSASDLMTEICDHLLSQGVADAEIHGYSYQPLSANGSGRSPQQPGHFTYGLPNLDVAAVVATPVPEPDKFLGAPLNIVRLNYHIKLSDDEILGLSNRSPSEHPERHYVRVRTSSWDGQLTTSVFVNAALQGHFLRVIMRPYVLAPVVSELAAADGLTQWNPFFLACVAVSVTVREFLAAAAKFKRSDNKPDKSGRAGSSGSGLRSTREYYARPYVNNMHQGEDSRRAIQVIEEKVFTVTMDFLKDHNVDVADYEKQVQNIIYNNTISGSGNITSGTFNDSQVANVSGQGNTANNTKTTTTNGKS
jgi:hypothetical protein